MVRRRQHSKGDTPERVDARIHLRAEDEALWRHVTQGVKPSRFRPRVPHTDVSGAAMQSARGEVKRADLIPVDTGQERRRVAVLTRAAKPAVGSKSSGPVRAAPQIIDHNAVRRLGNGRAAIDARVDLHGLRQSEAHAALRRFLFHAVQKGHRLVLVITGKGGRRGGASVIDAGRDDIVYESRQDTGVLRRQVPMWLREPEFQAIVVGFTIAHIRHGGDGALYVQLRRRK